MEPLTDSPVRDPRKLRVRVGLAFVRTLRPALYALLVASCFLTFWAGGDIAGHALPDWAASGAPIFFAVFLVVFAVYRLALVRAKRYPAAVGLFQIGLGALLWVLLLPGTRQRIASAQSKDDLPALLVSADARVRALAAEVVGTRPEGSRYVAALIDRLQDPDARVRRRARASLVKLVGEDPAPGDEGATAQARFRALARARGWVQ